MEKLTNIIESLLFVSGKEISIADIAEKLEISKNEVKLAAMELQEKYSGDSGLHFIYFNDKIQFGSNPEYGEAVSAVLNPIRERELSTSMLEVAAIIAYTQPVTRLDLEELRGRNSEYAIQKLLALELIEVVGKKDAIGHPSLFGTTDKFLKRFRISSLEQLPDYDELLDRIKMLRDASISSDYLYEKDVYIDDGSDDNMPPQRQFIPKEDASLTEDPKIVDIKDEEVPEFLKGEQFEIHEVDDDEDYDEDDDYIDEDEEDDDDGDFEEYEIDDEEYSDDDEEDDTSDYDDDEELADEDYEEDDI